MQTAIPRGNKTSEDCSRSRAYHKLGTTEKLCLIFRSGEVDDEGSELKFCFETIERESDKTFALLNRAGRLCSPSRRWRKGRVPHPNCHLVIKAVRRDSTPGDIGGLPLSKAILSSRLSL